MKRIIALFLAGILIGAVVASAAVAGVIFVRINNRVILEPVPTAIPGPRPVPPPPEGPLAGLVVYLSAGHGWLLHRRNHDGVAIGWGTQRGTKYGMREDDWTAQFVADDLAPALEAAGATVLALRERDRNPVETVIDDREEQLPGTPGTFAAFGLDGWVTDPLAEGGSARRLLPGGSANWTLTVPSEGHWYLYTRWLEQEDQDAQAIYTVRSGEDLREIVVDQRDHGSHWWPLGDDCLPAGSVVEVTLTGSGTAPLSADAIRLGGGSYTILLPFNFKLRTTPYFDVSMSHQLERLGGPEWLGEYECGNPVSDMRLRPHWSNWAGEHDDDSVFVSIHTNASPFGSPKGLTTFYGVDSTPPTAPNPDSMALAALLDRHVHEHVARHDAGYVDRGSRPGDYSEISPVHNMLPSALLEMGFHDNPDDARRLQSQQFRTDAAEGIAVALAEWRATRQPVRREPNGAARPGDGGADWVRNE